MSITFRQLEIFVAAAKDCNFRRTADRLGISQPSVSNHVRALESHLGHSLFARRRGSSPALSAEGLAFLDKAQQLVMNRAGIGASGLAPGDSTTVNLTVMAGPLLLDACIRPRLTGFCIAHPRIALQFVPLHPSRSPARLLNDGEIDLAAFTGDCSTTGQLKSETVDTVGCSIYASPALAARARQPHTRLEDLPWVMPQESFSPTRFMWRFLRDANIRPRNIVARSQFPEVAANMALGGFGVTMLFDDFASRGLAEGQLVRIGPTLPRTSRLLLIGRRAQDIACEPAVRLLRQALRTPLCGSTRATPAAAGL